MKYGRLPLWVNRADFACPPHVRLEADLGSAVVRLRTAARGDSDKSETMTFNYCCFAIGATTASWLLLQGVIR
jgi:hypothetical protein